MVSNWYPVLVPSTLRIPGTPGTPSSAGTPPSHGIQLLKYPWYPQQLVRKQSTNCPHFLIYKNDKKESALYYYFYEIFTLKLDDFLLSEVSFVRINIY